MLSFLLRRSPLIQMSCSMAKLFSSSPHLNPAVLPSHRETHFWYIKPDEVKDTSLLSHYQTLLSPCEKQSVLRMKGENLQKRALLARVLVRTTLSRYTDSLMTPSSFKFKKNTFGKPEVEWQVDKNPDLPSLQFNLSHTSSLIACGATSNMAIGIDVEEKERKTMHNLLSLARRYFTSDEVEYLKKFTDSDMQSHEFIKLWTLKEAYVKALGKGFSGTPFTNFNIRLGESKIVVDTPEGSADLTTKWEFTQFELDNSHYASICVDNSKLKGEEKDDEDAMKLKVWKTLPFVHDEFVSQTGAVRAIKGEIARVGKEDTGALQRNWLYLRRKRRGGRISRENYPVYRTHREAEETKENLTYPKLPKPGASGNQTQDPLAQSPRL